MRVVVTVDRSDPRRVEPDWDSVFGTMPSGPLGYAAGVQQALGGP